MSKAKLAATKMSEDLTHENIAEACRLIYETLRGRRLTVVHLQERTRVESDQCQIFSGLFITDVPCHRHFQDGSGLIKIVFEDVAIPLQFDFQRAVLRDGPTTTTVTVCDFVVTFAYRSGSYRQYVVITV